MYIVLIAAGSGGRQRFAFPSRQTSMAVERGLVTSAGLPLDDCIQLAGETDLDFVEILMGGSGAPKRLNEDAQQIQNQLRDHELDCLVHLPFSGIDIGIPYPHAREGMQAEIDAALRIAGELNARKAVLHPTSGANTPGQQRALMAEGVQRAVETGTVHGVEICAENMFGKYVTINQMDDVLDETDASLTLDTGHARIEGFYGDDQAAFLESNADSVSHVHLNDTRGPKDEHLPFGAGMIDFDPMFDLIRDGTWQGSLSLELYTHDLEYMRYSVTRLDDLLRP